jgi:hypothetical protein
MKQLLLLFCLINSHHAYKHPCEEYFKFNTCEFKGQRRNFTNSMGFAIIRYSIKNNQNTRKTWLSEYFLVHNSKDTFNIIQIFNQPSSDSIIRKYRWSTNWKFERMKDTCMDFYSQIDLKKEMNQRYPVVIGRIYAEID